MQVPQVQVIEKIVEIPDVQMDQGTRTSESLGTAPARRVVAESAPPTSVTAHVIDMPPVVMEDAQPVPVGEYVAPAPVVTYAVMAPVVGNIVPTPAATYEEQAPVAEYIAPAPAVTYVERAPVVEYIAPAPVVSYAAPSPYGRYHFVSACHVLCSAGSCDRIHCSCAR